MLINIPAEPAPGALSVNLLSPAPETYAAEDTLSLNFDGGDPRGFDYSVYSDSACKVELSNGKIEPGAATSVSIDLSDSLSKAQRVDLHAVFTSIEGFSTTCTNLEQGFYFDPSSSSEWRQQAQLIPFSNPRGVEFENKIYVFGQCPSSGSCGSSVFIMDPSDPVLTWEVLSPAGGPSLGTTSTYVVLNDLIYTLIGGVLWTFDPNTGSDGTWTQLNPTGYSHPSRHFYSMVTYDGKIYVHGGANDPSILANVYYADVIEYDPSIGSDGQWTNLNVGDPMMVAAHGVYNGKWYITQGYSMNSYTNNLYEFDFVTKSWNLISPINSPPTAGSGWDHGVLNNKVYVFVDGGATTL